LPNLGSEGFVGAWETTYGEMKAPKSPILRMTPGWANTRKDGEMIIYLSQSQMDELEPVFKLVNESCPDPFKVHAGEAPDNRGVVLAQVYRTYMKVGFIESEPAKKMMKILEKYKQKKREVLFRKF
jgi:hypothetical protein